MCGVAGFLLGIPALRLRGLYLALLTLGLAIATPQIIKRADGLTGGTQGLSVPRSPRPAWSGLADDQWLYFVTLAVAAIMFVLAAFLVRGRVGRALVAIRENEIAARTMGVDLARYKTGAFAVSAGYAGSAARCSRCRSGSSRPSRSRWRCRSRSWRRSSSAAWPRSPGRCSARCSSSSSRCTPPTSTRRWRG